MLGCSEKRDEDDFTSTTVRSYGPAKRSPTLGRLVGQTLIPVVGWILFPGCGVNFINFIPDRLWGNSLIK